MLVDANGLSGKTYVVFGQNGGFPASIAASNLLTTSNPRGLILTNAGQRIRWAPAISTARRTAATISTTWLFMTPMRASDRKPLLVFGNATISSIPTNLTTLNGTKGVTLTDTTYGLGAGGRTGVAVGDYNHDGFRTSSSANSSSCERTADDCSTSGAMPPVGRVRLPSHSFRRTARSACRLHWDPAQWGVDPNTLDFNNDGKDDLAIDAGGGGRLWLILGRQLAGLQRL